MQTRRFNDVLLRVEGYALPGPCGRVALLCYLIQKAAVRKRVRAPRAVCAWLEPWAAARTPSVAMLPHGMAPASSARAIAAAPTSPMLVSPSCRIARLRGGAAAAAVTAVATVALPAASAAAAPAAPGRSSRGLSSSAAASAAQPASAMGLEPSARRRRTERSPGWG